MGILKFMFNISFKKLLRISKLCFVCYNWMYCLDKGIKDISILTRVWLKNFPQDLHDAGHEQDLPRGINIHVDIITENFLCILHVLGEIQKKVDIQIIYMRNK